MRTALRRKTVAVLVLLAVAGWGQGASAVRQADVVETAGGSLAALRASLGPQLLVSRSAETGLPSMVRARPPAVLHRDDAAADPESRARAFLTRFGDLVGLTAGERSAAATGALPKAGSELRLLRIHQDVAGGHHVKFDQYYAGLKVFGAQLVVHLTRAGVTAVNGTFIPGLSLNPIPAVRASKARALALGAIDDASASVESTRLEIYREGLIDGTSGRNHLAWAVEVEGAEHFQGARSTGVSGRSVEVWVDGHDGAVLNELPLQAHSHQDKHRTVYTPEFVPQEPLLFAVRDETHPAGVPVGPVETLYRYTGQVYDMFENAFGFTSYDDGAKDADGVPAVMRTVYLINSICPNAYWDGYATNYCPGFDLDDVVAHEWGHAYTDYTHNLVYQCQPGALNESYSDIWGEVIDLRNGEDGIGGANNAQPWPAGQRWLIGEDLTERVHRLLLRDMWDPERLGHPARVGSVKYGCGTADNEGVHSNSGVPNHAFAMLTDGKTFNGETVRGIGLTKASHIYWQASAAYQTRTSKFSDHADALEASCADLLGVDLNGLDDGQPSGEIITADDCLQVEAAMRATQMRGENFVCRPHSMLRPDPPAECTGTAVFTEDFEDGLAGWSLHSEGASFPDTWPGYDWEANASLPGGRTGTAAYAVNSEAGNCRRGPDISGRFWMDSTPVSIPAGAGGVELRFDHYVATKRPVDGGNVKVSVNGGEFTVLEPGAYAHNPPNETLGDAIDPLNGNNSNPLAGESAWSGTDRLTATGTWGTTVANLSGVAEPGDVIVLRFDFGVNCGGGIDGWYVDDVQLLACLPSE